MLLWLRSPSAGTASRFVKEGGVPAGIFPHAIGSSVVVAGVPRALDQDIIKMTMLERTRFA
jgi:hypothetical protein